VLSGIKGDSRVRLEFRQNGDRRIFDVPGVRIDAAKAEVVQKHFTAGLKIEVAKG